MATRLQSQSLRARLARGTVWSGVGSVAAQGSSLLMALIVARLLGVDVFGQFVLILSTAVMLQGAGAMGLGLTTTRFVATLRNQDLTRAGRVIGFALLFTLSTGSLLACLGLVIPGSLIQSAFGVKGLDWVIRFVGIIAFFEILNNIQTSVLMGLEAFAATSTINILRGVLILSLAVLGACTFGLAGTLTGYAAASLVTCLLSQVVTRRECRRRGIALSFRGSLAEYRVLTMSVCVTLSSVTLAIVTWLLNVWLARQPNGLSELAIFNAAERWRTAILFLPGLITRVSLPLFAHTQAEKGGRHYGRLVIETALLNLAVTALPVTVMLLFPAFFMSGYGEAFARGKLVLVMLAVTCLPTSVYAIGAYSLWAQGKTGTMVTVDTLRTAIILFYCLRQPHLEALHVAKAGMFAYLVGVGVMAFLLRRTIRQERGEGGFAEAALPGEGV